MEFAVQFKGGEGFERRCEGESKKGKEYGDKMKSEKLQRSSGREGYHKKVNPGMEKVEYPSLYHYTIFSDNVLVASVVVNSTVQNANDPEKHVFHIVTDKLNFPSMRIWFLINPHATAMCKTTNLIQNMKQTMPCN
ncbi:hypothetical protein RYX36_027126 [Vicia faba]